MEFTNERKKEVEKMIVDSSVDALEAGLIKEYDLSVIADFVLSKIDNIKTEEELVVFLEDLAAKWKFFLPIERFIEQEVKHEEEKKIVAEAQNYAKNGNINDALAALKQAQ